MRGSQTRSASASRYATRSALGSRWIPTALGMSPGATVRTIPAASVRKPWTTGNLDSPVEVMHIRSQRTLHRACRTECHHGSCAGTFGNHRAISPCLLNSPCICSRCSHRCRGRSLSSSPWMRGAPQPGFSWHILRIRSRTSQQMRGRPRRPRRTFQVQNLRMSAR